MGEHLWMCVGLRSDYAVQQRDGRYLRAFRPLSSALLSAHLAGRLTIGTYVITAEGTCSFAVFDADRSDGLAVLLDVQQLLAEQGYPAYLEQSRRGGHLWLFFAQPTPAEQIRRWLGPIASARALELYPRQAGGKGIGSLIRMPFGKHRRSGQRYPFLDRELRPVAPTVAEQVAWLAQVERIVPPDLPQVSIPAHRSSSTQWVAHGRSIREWNAQQDPFALIGRYVHLDSNGSGRCPFGSHHAGAVMLLPHFACILHKG